LVIDVADAFEEEQREDVALEVGLIDRPAQDVRRTPKVLLQLRKRQRFVLTDRAVRRMCVSHSLFSDPSLIVAAPVASAAMSDSRTASARRASVTPSSSYRSSAS